MPHLRRRFSRMTLASASTAARRLSVPKLATLWHHLFNPHQDAIKSNALYRLVVANGCQYMSIHVNTHQVSPCELCDSAPTRRGDHRWRWSLVPNAQSRIQHDPTRLPTVETRLHDLEQIRFRNLRHPATLQHGQRQQQLLYWSTPRWEIHLGLKV